MVLTVWIPRPCSMYTTSSVATFPEAPWAYGQPPSPATDESTTLIPFYRIKNKSLNKDKRRSYFRKQSCSSTDLQSHEDVSESLAVGIVAVHRQGADRNLPDDNVQHFTHAARSPHSDGVAEGDLVAAHGVQTLGNLQGDGRKLELFTATECVTSRPARMHPAMAYVCNFFGRNSAFVRTPEDTGDVTVVKETEVE